MKRPGRDDVFQPLFAWYARHEGAGWLTFWVMIALAMHAGVFVLLRPQYPPADNAITQSASLSVVLPGTSMARSLQSKVVALDPALYAPERSISYTAPLPQTPVYQPSFRYSRPILDPMPESAPNLRPPLVQAGELLRIPEKLAEPPATATAPGLATKLILGGALAQRKFAELRQHSFRARYGDQLMPAEFLLGVAPDGRVLHVIALRSSGNANLDQSARTLLASAHLDRAPERAVTWGTAAVLWGADLDRSAQP